MASKIITSLYSSTHLWLLCVGIQWNLSIPDTLGTAKSVQYKEVSLFQRLTFRAIGTQASVHYMEDVLVSEVSTVWGSTVCTSRKGPFSY